MSFLDGSYAAIINLRLLKYLCTVEIGGKELANPRSIYTTILTSRPLNYLFDR